MRHKKSHPAYLGWLEFCRRTLFYWIWNQFI